MFARHCACGKGARLLSCCDPRQFAGMFWSEPARIPEAFAKHHEYFILGCGRANEEWQNKIFRLC